MHRKRLVRGSVPAERQTFPLPTPPSGRFLPRLIFPDKPVFPCLPTRAILMQDALAAEHMRRSLTGLKKERMHARLLVAAEFLCKKMRKRY